MSRRGDNIRKRKDGRWEARIIERHTEDGKACYKSIYANSYTEAKNKLINYQKQDMSKKNANHTKTMHDVSEQWLECMSIKLKQSTYALYYRRIQEHIIPYFKNTKVDRISNDMVNRFIREKSENGRLDKKGGLAPKTINDLVSLLNQIMLFAQKKGYAKGYNLDWIKPNQEYKELTILSKSEQNQLAGYLKLDTDAVKFGVLISLYTGIRLGELCALKWSDINIQDGTLKIDKTIQRIKNTEKYATTKTKIVIDKPKSQKSLRVVPIPSFLHDKLSSQRNRSFNNSYILTGDNTFIEPRTYQKHFKRILKGANIRDVNFHALRHTYATRAIESGIDIKTLSELLGHSSVKFTLERYVHSSIELKKESVEKLAVSY